MNNSITLDSGKKVPTDLYRTDAGIQYFNQLSENRNWGLRGSVGYVGDKPSANSRDLTYGFSANYNFPGSGNGAWMLSVMFSNNGPLVNNIPIPGVGYLYKTDTFIGMFGFPFASMRWTPDSPWSYSLAFMGPMVQSEIDYGGMDRIQYFSGFSWTRDSYIQSNRENDKDRLTIEEKKAAVGFRAPVWGLLTEFQFGRAFDRSIYIGNGLFNKDGGSDSLESEWYVSASVKVKF